MVSEAAAVSSDPPVKKPGTVRNSGNLDIIFQIEAENP